MKNEMQFSISYCGYNGHSVFTKTHLTRFELRKVWDMLTRKQKLRSTIWSHDAHTREHCLYRLKNIPFNMC